MTTHQYELISHILCPYVQRAVILMQEKCVPFTRTDIQLDDKHDWFLAMSPTGKVPLLRVGQGTVLFESAAICEYLDEVSPGSLHPQEPAARATHRAWMEFGSSLLNLIARFYSAQDQSAYELAAEGIRGRIVHLEKELALPFFAGQVFSMVDAVFAPVFRYFDVFEKHVSMAVFEDCPGVQHWRNNLRNRPSVQSAVSFDYAEQLEAFVMRKNSFLGRLIENNKEQTATRRL